MLAYLDRGVGEGRVKEIEDHIDGCATCRRLVSELVALDRKKSDVALDKTSGAAAPRPSGRLVAGARIGKYALVDVLGEGGMGIVWSAHDPDLDRTLAIKVIKRSDAPAQLRMRLLREARAMARLKHPNVLTVYEVGTEGDRDFIAMELVDGSSLDEWLRTQPSDAAIYDALIAAGRGLAAAHAAGLVHRDFKPHNVLRRKEDGRVLVTDFGLARGMSDESLPPAPVTDRSIDGHDSVLDTPLTQTGMLIGTPAYMAPEQFTGSEPDPRTDQFAFCVTAWQALTGARPFSGTTLDELRRSACAGVGEVQAMLPPPVREVLTRGLDPDPFKRWPDLDHLLAALGAAIRPPRRRWLYGIAAAGALAAVIVAVVALRSRGGAPPAPPPCPPAEQVLDGAWGPTERAAAAKNAPDGMVRELDEYGRRWSAAWNETCRDAGSGARRERRSACLVATRDRLTALARLAATADRATLDAIEVALVLPPPACDRAAPPALPEPAIAALARAYGVIGALGVDGTVADLERAAAWPPVVAEALVEAGDAHLRAGELAAARKAYRRAVASPEPRDLHVLARARIGLYAASLVELEQPGEGNELARLRTYARTDVKAAAGDGPGILAGELALAEARGYLGIAAWSGRKPADKAYGDALAAIAEARRGFEAAGAPRRLAAARALEAAIYLRRNDERALDDADFAARSAADTLTRAGATAPPALAQDIDELLAAVAFARGDFVQMHERLDHWAPARKPAGTPHRGIVLGPDGAPAARTLVVAWTGELAGDPRRVYSDPRGFRGEIVETAADGSFEVHAEPGAAVIAQLRDLRSAPQPIGEGPSTVRLVATAPVVGPTELGGRDAMVYARYVVANGATWTVRAPIEKDHTFHIGWLPKGTPLLGTDGRSGDGTRRTTATNGALAWPAGRLVEIVVRSRHPGGVATAWLLPGAPHATTTRADVQLQAATATDVVTVELHPIGADASTPGRAIYAPGDRHAYVTASPGLTAVCVDPGLEPAQVKCVRALFPAGPDDEAAPLLVELD